MTENIKKVKLADELGARIWGLNRSIICPIYAKGDRGDADHIATSFMVNFEEVGRFLLTAGHVIHDHGHRDLFIVHHDQFIPITGKIMISSDLGSRADKLDFALIPFRNLSLADDLECVNIPSNDDGLGPDGGVYAMFGFPNTQNRTSYKDPQKIVPQPILISGQFDEKLAVPPSYRDQGRRHVFICYHKRNLHDGFGRKTNQIKPQGLSGGPVFLLWDEEKEKSGSSNDFVQAINSEPVAMVIERPSGSETIVSIKLAAIRSVLIGTDGERPSELALPLANPLCDLVQSMVQSQSEKDT